MNICNHPGQQVHRSQFRVTDFSARWSPVNPPTAGALTYTASKDFQTQSAPDAVQPQTGNLWTLNLSRNEYLNLPETIGQIQADDPGVNGKVKDNKKNDLFQGKWSIPTGTSSDNPSLLKTPFRKAIEFKTRFQGLGQF